MISEFIKKRMKKANKRSLNVCMKVKTINPRLIWLYRAGDNSQRVKMY